MIETITELLSNLHWVRVIIALLGTAVAVVFGIYLPARVFEDYTNQPAIRWVWYVAGTMTLVMVYISMYGYGFFWNAYQDTKDQNPINLEQPKER